MAKSMRICAPDVRAIVRLVGECRELGDDPLVWRRHFLGGVARLVDADLAGGGETLDCIAGPVRSPGVALWGFEHGFNLDGLRIVWEWNETDPFISVIWQRVHEQLAAAPAPGVTRARQQMIADREWDGTADLQQAMRTLGADPVVQSFRQLPQGGDAFDGAAWFRAAGRPNFDEREVAIIELAHQEVTELVGGALATFAEPRPTDLSPRLRDVLRCLLDGDSDKQMAARLGLSTHTVNQYTKQVFRHFGATSRPELLARWLRRGWRSRAAWLEPAPEPCLLVP